MGAELKLIATPQSFYWTRVQWALKLKGVEWIHRRSQKQEPFASQTYPAYKKVPVILRHGKPLAEFFTILEYIDEVWKHNPLLPADPSEKSIARFWAKFADDKMHTIFSFFLFFLVNQITHMFNANKYMYIYCRLYLSINFLLCIWSRLGMKHGKHSNQKEQRKRKQCELLWSP